MAVWWHMDKIILLKTKLKWQPSGHLNCQKPCVAKLYQHNRFHDTLHILTETLLGYNWTSTYCLLLPTNAAPVIILLAFITLRIMTLVLTLVDVTQNFAIKPFKEQSWLSWLVRGFLSERSPVRSSVTSTSASTFFWSV